MIRYDSKKELKPLIKNKNIDISHPLLNVKILESYSNKKLKSTNKYNEIPPNNSVWPLESDLIIESVEFRNNELFVTLTNVSTEMINLDSMGVKYSSSNTESINFEPANLCVPPGEKTLKIPCPEGKPFKFVIRTENGTGIGTSSDFMNW